MKGSRTGYRSGFDPRSIDGCQLWLDAADRATLTLSGSNVTAWADKSGNGRNASAQVAATYSSASNALSFTGSNYYSFGDFSFAVANYFSFFIVEKLQSSSGEPTILGTDSTGLNQAGHIRYNGVNATTNASTFKLGFFGNDLQLSNIPAFTTATLQPVRVWSIVFTASFRGIYLNGTLMGSDTNNTQLVSWNTPLMGRAFVGINPTNFYYNGFLYEILGYGGQITSAQRQQVEGYLARKWGLQASINMLPIGHPYKYGTPGFVPTSISGCRIWLDAADTSTMTLSGSNVTQWNDKSGQGINFTAAGSSTAPVLSNYNGLPAIAWTGTTQQLTSISNNPTPGSAARSIFFVTHNPLATSKIYAVTGTETGANPAIAWGYAKNADLDYTYPFLYAIAGTDIFSNVQIRDRATILTTTFDGTSNITGWINSDYQIAKTGGINTATTPWYLGLRPSGTGSLDSFLLEFLVYNTSLTTAQRQQVEGYLAWKWGTKTTTLPTTHPYVSIPPTLRPFAPVDVPGCSLWLDAADAATITLSGSNVTAWADKSGNGYTMTQSTTSRGPLVTQVGANNMLQFVRANQTYLINTSFTPLMTNFTIFLVIKRNAVTDNQRWFVAIPSGYATDWTTTTGLYIATYVEIGSVGTTANYLDYTNLDLGLFTFNASNNTASFYKNGSASALFTKSLGITGNSVGVLLGAGTSGGSINLASEMFDGYMGEVLMYSGGLTNAQQRQVEGYLAKKWGLQANMPTPHPYRYSQPIGFTPTSISGCSLWLDAADTSSITLSGSNVTAWRDKSGNINVATTGQGTPSLGLINGQPSMSVGVSANLYMDPLTNPINQSAVSAFVVTSISNTINSFGRILSFGRSSDGTANNDYATTPNFIFCRDATNSAVSIYRNGTSITGSVTYGPTPFLMGAVFDGTTCFGYLNGTQFGSFASSGTFTFNRLGIGVNINTKQTAQDIYTGQIGEVLVYYGALTTTQRQQVEGYLAWKWGLQRNLPTGHLYQFGLPPLTAGFTPTAISGCSLWLDAADRTSLTLSGSNVTQWNDKSGNGRNVTQGTTALQPTYSSSSNAIVFSSTGYLNIPSALSAITPTYTIFVVEKRATSNVTFFLGQHTLFSGNTALILGYNDSSTSHHTTAYISDLQVTIPAYQGANEPTRMTRYGYTGSARSTVINGGQYSASQSFSATLPVWSNANIGAGFWTPGQAGQTWWYAGNIYEMIFFNQALSTSQSQQVEGYLAHKWGLVSSLPNNHPYRLIKP